MRALMLVPLLTACITYIPLAPRQRGGEEAGDTGGDEILLAGQSALSALDAEACAQLWYPDADQDGYGLTSAARPFCAQPAGWLSVAGDCDDSDDDVHPGAEETCNEVDDDCDGAVDEDPIDGTVYYVDADGDGRGDPSRPVELCRVEDGYSGSLRADDCDDTNAEVNPRAEEIPYDGFDQDCDPSNEYDADEDGFDAADYGGTDCNDDNNTVNPSKSETCDRVDNDCDGLIDDAPTTGGSWRYTDADLDGYGSTTRVYVCAGAPGSASSSSDCVDTDASIHPGATEIWYDGVNQDCASGSDYDADGDSYTSADYGGWDCDDALKTVTMYYWYPDADGDGVGADFSPSADCEDPGEGWSADNDDCDDEDEAISPLLAEVCGDDIDNNCDEEPIGCGLFDTLTLDDAEASWLGAAAGDGLGAEVAVLGDLTGDGVAELAVSGTGADGSGADRGLVWVLDGAGVLGGSPADALGTWEGSADAMAFGGTLTAVGDVNGDGFEDLVGAAPDWSGSATATGHVAMVLGPLSGALTAEGTLEGSLASDQFGYALSGGADLTGDGLADLVVGAPQRDRGLLNTGSAWIFSGAWTGTMSATDAEVELYGASASQLMGDALTVVEDLDGDGFAELVVHSGQGSSSGRVSVFLGPLSGSLSTSSADLTWTSVGGSGGHRIASAGDVSGDGANDLLIGDASASSSVGVAYLLTAFKTSTSLSSAAAAKVSGAVATPLTGAVSGGADVDLDGYGDVAVGASTTTSGGAIYLLRGPLSGSVSLSSGEGSVTGRSGGDGVGQDFSALQDLDGDGEVELVVGAPGDDTQAINSGGIYLFGGLSAL